MDKKKRDRSFAGRMAAAEALRRKGDERVQRLSDENIRRAEGRAKGELRELGSAALTAALADPVFRAKLITTVRGRVLAEQKVIEIALNGKLLAHLEAIPEPVAEPVEQTPLPIIAVEASGAANVIRYAPLVLRSMSDQDLHTRIMALIGATYVDDIKCWACPHPEFEAVMKSIGRDLDRRIEGLQPDMACRVLTTDRLEKVLAGYGDVEKQEASLKWEEIASIDHWVPEIPEPVFCFTHSSQGDTQLAPRRFDRLDDIGDAETASDYRQDIEVWNGTWSRDGRVVSVTEVRQSIVLALWGVRVSEARVRIAQGGSARDKLDRLYRERREAERLAEEKQAVRAAMRVRRSKYGDNN